MSVPKRQRMTTDDLKELLDYIMKNNSWKEMSYYNCNRK